MSAPERVALRLLLDEVERLAGALAEARGDSPSGFWSQREWEDWSNELAGLIPDGDESKYANPEGAQESIIEDCFRAYVEALEVCREQRTDLREMVDEDRAENQRLREGITSLADDWSALAAAQVRDGDTTESEVTRWFAHSLRALLGGVA